MNPQDTLKKTGDFIRNSATLKIVSIGILILVLLIPTSMISSLTQERESRRDSVVKEINQKWGMGQTLTGPFFTIPYKSFYKDENEKQKFNIHYLHILPERLKISGNIDPLVRYRSIYEAILYNAQITVSGNFTIPALSQSNIDPDNVLWNLAIFSIGITDMKGIGENIEITFNQKKYSVSPGLKTTDIAAAGVSSVIPLSPSENTNPFLFQLNINGSEQLQFIPVAEETNVELKSGWPSPSFNGAFLPTTRNITANSG